MTRLTCSLIKSSEQKLNHFQVDPTQSKEQWSCATSSHEPVVLDIIRHDRSNLDLRTQNGYVRFRLRKFDMLFSGKEWLLTDSNTAESTAVVLKKNCLSKVTTINQGQGGHTLARLSAGLFQSGRSFRWGSETYRWNICHPDKLMLINIDTDEVHAIMSTRFTTYPWSRDQGRIMLFGKNRDSTWMRVVIAGAVAEAANKKPKSHLAAANVRS